MSIDNGKDEYALMKGKIQYLTEKMSKVVCLTYDLIPIDQENYKNQLMEVYQSMKSTDPIQKNLSQHDELILGKIEGQSAFTDLKIIIESVVGEVNEQKLKLYLKQKTEQRNYGISTKDKNCSIKQVKKIQYLNKYFDIKQINKKRKHNTLYRNYIKSLHKFLYLFTKTDQNNNEAINNLWEQYQIFWKYQKKLQQHLKQMQTVVGIIQKDIIIGPILSPPEQGKEEEKLQLKSEQEHKINLQQKKDQQNKNKSPKKNIKTYKNTKKQQNQVQEIILQQNQINIHQRQKAIEQVQLLPSSTLPSKKDDKQKKLDFFVFKKPQNSIKLLKPMHQPLVASETNNIAENTQIQINKMLIKTQIPKASFSYWHLVGSQIEKPEINKLRAQFKSFKMQNQQLSNNPYFLNMIITLSIIEHNDFLMKPDREIDFTSPFKRIKQILYFEDESEQFEGENASENMEDEQEEESALSQNNKTILDDDHLSNEELSSCQSNQLDLKVEYGKGAKWIFNSKNSNTELSIEIMSQFQIICLYNEPLPLAIEEEEDKIQLIISPQTWRDIYRITHASFGIKDLIIKQISNILPNVTKNWIDTMLKQRSQKIGNQRFVVKAFVKDLKDKIIDIQEILEDIMSIRNEELKRIRDEKNQEKDLKLEKDILQCTGSRYIINLMKQLKQKGYKQLRKNQLILFINQRNGEEWQKIKAQMNTMSITTPNQIEQLQNQEGLNENNQIQCEEEVVVQDQQYNKSVEKSQEKQNSQASTKQKNTDGNFTAHAIQNTNKRQRKIPMRSLQFQQTLLVPSISNKNTFLNKKNNIESLIKRQSKLNNFIKKQNPHPKQIKTKEQINNIEHQMDKKMNQEQIQNQMVEQLNCLQNEKQNNLKRKEQIEDNNQQNQRQVNYQYLDKTSQKLQFDI